MFFGAQGYISSTLDRLRARLEPFERGNKVFRDGTPIFKENIFLEDFGRYPTSPIKVGSCTLAIWGGSQAKSFVMEIQDIIEKVVRVMKNDFSQMSPRSLLRCLGMSQPRPWPLWRPLRHCARLLLLSMASLTTRPQVLASFPPKASLNRWNVAIWSKITKKCFFFGVFFSKAIYAILF